MNERRQTRHLTQTNRARRRGEHGAVAVEFALIMPILVMLLLGVTTAGLAYADHLAVQNAVREGGRLGAAIPYSSTTPPITPAGWGDSVQQRVQQVYFNSSSSLTTDMICVKLFKDDGTTVLASPTAQGTNCGADPAVPTISAGNCVVAVWVRKTGAIKLGVFPDIPFTLSAKSLTYYGRTAGPCTASL